MRLALALALSGRVVAEDWTTDHTGVGDCKGYWHGQSAAGHAGAASGRALSTSVEVMAQSVHQHTTYRVVVHLEGESENVYTIFGDRAVEAGSPAQLQFPASYQCPPPFGADTGGTNPAFWALANGPETGYSQFDSWLTVGITEGDTTAELSNIGLTFRSWDQHTPLTSDVLTGGAVFWMSPERATLSVGTGRTVTIAQLTLADGVSSTASFGAQGQAFTREVSSSDKMDWVEHCITVVVGGAQSGHGSHAHTAPPLVCPASAFAFASLSALPALMCFRVACRKRLPLHPRHRPLTPQRGGCRCTCRRQMLVHLPI